MAKGIASGLPLSGILAHRELLAKLPPGIARRDVRRQRRVLRRGARDARRDRGRGSRRQRPGPRRPARRRAARAPGGPSRRSATSAASAAWSRWSSSGPGTGRGAAAPDPDPDLAKRVIAAALERELIVLSAGSYANVARIIPPLVTTSDEVDHALRDPRREPRRGGGMSERDDERALAALPAETRARLDAFARALEHVRIDDLPLYVTRIDGEEHEEAVRTAERVAIEADSATPSARPAGRSPTR